MQESVSLGGQYAGAGRFSERVGAPSAQSRGLHWKLHAGAH